MQKHVVYIDAQVLGADGLLYQSIDDLLAVAQSLNPDIQQFEASCFTGEHQLDWCFLINQNAAHDEPTLCSVAVQRLMISVESADRRCTANHYSI